MATVVKDELREHAKKRVRVALDYRIDRLWRAHYNRQRHQTFELGEQDLLLTGHGKLGSRTVEQPEGTSTTFRAWRGVVKVWALSDDVVVGCKGRGCKRTWTKKDGVAVTKCKGIGTASVSGKNFMVFFKARLGQAKFPAGSVGTIHTWSRQFAGPEMPDDPDGVVLNEKASDAPDPPSNKPADETPAETDSTTQSRHASSIWPASTSIAGRRFTSREGRRPFYSRSSQHLGRYWIESRH